METGWPVLMALSNKDFVGETLDLPVDRAAGGHARRDRARRRRPGAAMFRAHQVVATRRVLEMVASIEGTRPPAAIRADGLSLAARPAIAARRARRRRRDGPAIDIRARMPRCRSAWHHRCRGHRPGVPGHRGRDRPRRVRPRRVRVRPRRADGRAVAAHLTGRTPGRRHRRRGRAPDPVRPGPARLSDERRRLDAWTGWRTSSIGCTVGSASSGESRCRPASTPPADRSCSRMTGLNWSRRLASIGARWLSGGRCRSRDRAGGDRGPTDASVDVPADARAQSSARRPTSSAADDGDGPSA